MDAQTDGMIVLLITLEVIQLLLFWGLVRHRYTLSLRQLSRLTEELAAGRRPKSFYIKGRQFAPSGERWEKKLADWKQLYSDEDAFVRLELDQGAIRFLRFAGVFFF